MNKKGNSTLVVIAVIVFVFVIIGVITILVIANQDRKEKEKEVTEQSMDLYLSIKNSNYGIEGNYTILSNGNVLNGKIIKDSLTEIKNVSINSATILCKSTGYYSQLIEKQFTEEEKSYNSSKVECQVEKISNIEVRHTGSIANGSINLRVESNGLYKNLTICLSWTSNIIKVESEYTEEEAPARLFEKVDKCFNMNKTISGDKIDANFTITSNNPNTRDEINFYIFDKDIIYAEGMQTLSEYQGINLGAEDTLYIVK